MNNLTQRILTGVAGAAVITFLLWWNPYSMLALFFLLAMLSLYEYLLVVGSLKELHTAKGHILGNMLTGGFVFLLITGVGYGWLETKWLSLLLPCVAILFILELYQKRTNPFQHIGLRIIGIVYIVLPFSLMTLIGMQDGQYRPLLVMAILYTIWTDNAFAYFAGRAFGKHLLFERISPKKTWEGFAGGFTMALVCCYIFSGYDDHIPLWAWLVMGALISIVGTLGDLVESLFKRNLALKDSSQILPGHGGFLDRFDALFLAVPFIYAFLVIMGF